MVTSFVVFSKINNRLQSITTLLENNTQSDDELFSQVVKDFGLNGEDYTYQRFLNMDEKIIEKIGQQIEIYSVDNSDPQNPKLVKDECYFLKITATGPHVIKVAEEDGAARYTSWAGEQIQVKLEVFKEDKITPVFPTFIVALKAKRGLLQKTTIEFDGTISSYTQNWTPPMETVFSPFHAKIRDMSKMRWNSEGKHMNVELIPPE